MEIEQKRDYFLPVSILVSAVLISTSILYATRVQTGGAGTANVADSAKAAAETAPKVEKNDIVLGNPKAPVTMFVFEDYQCPYCAMFFSQTEKRVRDTFVKDGKVKMVFRGFQFLGPESLASGEAVACAKEQGKFWEMHDAIFTEELVDKKENNGNLTTAFFEKTAQNIGMDLPQFSSCLSTGKYKADVQAGTQDAAKYGVQSTPTFFLNGKKYNGALPFEGPSNNPSAPAVKDAIEALLKGR